MKKILVIQQKMIGDVLISTVICEQLKKHIPESEVHYLINSHTEAVVVNNPFIDQIVMFTQKYRESKMAFYDFLKQINQEKYDIVIDVYGKLESNLISLFSKAEIRIANPKWYSRFIYSHLVPKLKKKRSEIGLAIENRLCLLDPVLGEGKRTEMAPKIYLTKKEVEDAKSFLMDRGVNLSKPIIMLNILGSGENKTYPLSYMSELIDYIAINTDATLLFNYMPSQQEKADKIYALCTGQSRKKIVFDAFAPSLRTFLALLSHCAALIGNEGGAVNMAKALNIPTFSIYSPWINKLAWHTFNKNSSNMAVHLMDFHPERLTKKSRKELKAETLELYETFAPSLFLTQLLIFLSREVLPHK